VGLDRSDPPYRALGLLLSQNPTTRPRDQILASGDFTGEVSYTQADPFVGVPSPSVDNAGRMILEATGELAEPFAENIEAIALQAGMPAPAGGARLGWRYETASRYHGWEPPSTLAGYEAIEWTDGSINDVRETSRAHAVGLPDGRIVATYQDRYVVGTTQYRVRVATRDPSTGAWSKVTVYSSATAPSTAGSGGGFFPCLWRVEAQSYAQGGVAGVVYLAHWVEEGSSPAQGNLRVYSSTDGGTTWVTQTLRALREDVPLGTSAAQYIPGRLRVQSMRGTAMLVMALRNNTVSAGISRDIFAQYASPDEGLDFRRIALWDETATSPREGGRYHDLITTAGRFVMLYITLDATIVGTGRPAYRYVTNAWEDLRNINEAPIDVDSSSNIWGLLSSGASGEQLTDGDLAAVVLPDQSIWVLGRETGSGVSNDECGAFYARNIFEPFEPVGFGRASGSAYGKWYTSRTSTTYPSGICATHQGGRVVVVTNHAANPGDEDNSLSALYLGGWSDVPLPGYTASPRVNKRMGWEFTWLPWDLPASAGWSQTVGGVYTAILSSPGHLAVAATVGRAYYSRTVTIPRATGAVILCELRVNSGGSLASDTIFMRLGSATAGQGNDVSVRIDLNGTQAQLYDNLGGALLGSAVALPNPGGWNQILFAMAGSKASAWACDSDIPAESREWTEIAAGVTVTQAASSALARWGVGGAGNVLADADFRMTLLSDSTSVGQAPYDLAPGLNAAAVFGGPIGTTFFPLGAGGGAARYASKTGPARAGDVWTIATDYEHPARNLHPLVKTTPRTGWRSSADDVEVTLAMRASSSTGDTAIPRDLLVSACFQVEQRTIILEGRQTASGLWTELATLDACGQGAAATAGLRYILTGDTLIPDTTANSPTTPWLHGGDYVGGYVDLGSGKIRRIYAQTGGLWADSATTPPVVMPVLHLEGIDGTESATGTCDIWSPRIAAIVDVADVRWQALRLRIEAQDTPNGRFAIGTWFLGYALTFGQPYGWGRGISQESGAVVEELEDGQVLAYQAKPARRAVSLAWDPIETSTLDEGGDYITGEIDIPPRAIASPQATASDLMGLLEATAQGRQPVLYLPRIEPLGPPTGQILTSRHDLWLARISDGPAFTAELGDENEDEMIAATLTLREEV
jgi:hypothetical protein